MEDRALCYFRQISAIPRASGNEEDIARYIESFAKERGFFVTRDVAHNVFVRKPASAGREAEPAILLQAHTDMVAERTPGSTHDFATEGIELIEEGNILRANGTTLGADDGFGVALMLAVLESDTLSHPTLECLFTSSEETGLMGIARFDFSAVTARRLVNLDSAEENKIIIGCCGGARIDLKLPLSFAPAAGTAYRLTVAGLCGGHSGEDIHRGRLNANILMGKLLSSLAAKAPLFIVSLSGGDKGNAIPRDCTAEFIYAGAERDVTALSDLARAQITSADDSALTVRFERTVATEAFTAECTAAALRILALPNGVIEKRADGSPYTSRNLARLRTEEGELRVGFSTRSPSPEARGNLKKELEDTAAAIGAKITQGSEYPGWEEPQDGILIKAWNRAYRKVAGKEADVTVIHAGLECGFIAAACPGMQALAIGCNIYDLHSPAERMEIDSFGRIERTLMLFLSEKI